MIKVSKKEEKDDIRKSGTKNIRNRKGITLVALTVTLRKLDKNARK